MLQNLNSAIRKAWTPSAQPLTICPDTIYRTYGIDQDPQVLFQKASQYYVALRVGHDEQHEGILQEETHNLIMHAIFGSNKIESAGLDLETTIKLCRQIFRGETVPSIVDGDPEYASKLLELVAHDKELKSQPAQCILRGRTEILQHMKAFQYILDRFAIHKQDMTENLLKETHSILCEGISIIDEEMPEVPSEMYAGKYRNVSVGAGSTMFVVPKFVPQKMAEMCDNLKREIREGEESANIDPFSLAAKYSLRFVEVHPFQDGNGRMCRMVLNAILFRFLGIVVPIGEREEDCAEYIGIKKRASEQMEGHGEYATYILKKGAKVLQKLKQKVHGKSNK